MPAAVSCIVSTTIAAAAIRSQPRQPASITTNTLGRLLPRHTFVITTTNPYHPFHSGPSFPIWAVTMSETGKSRDHHHHHHHLYIAHMLTILSPISQAATATRPPAKPLRNASPARSTAKHHLEPNPFEKSFSSGPTSSESIDRRSDLKSDTKSSLSTPPLSTRPGAAYRDRTFSKSQTSPSTTNNNDSASTPKPLLPPVASITSPAGESNPYPWSAGLTSSLRSGPLSPAMLAGPQSSHFDPNSFRTGFTPDLSNFKTGLTPLSGGMSFPPPSPNTAAFLAAMVNNTSAPSTSAAAITPNTLNALTNAAASATGSIDPNAPSAPTAPGAALSTQPQNFAGKPSDAHNAFDLAFSRSFPNDRAAAAAAEVKAGSKLKAQVKASDSDRSLSQSISPQMMQKPLDPVPGDQQNAASGLFLLSRAHQEMAKRDGATAASTSLYESKPAAAAASKKGAKGKGEDARPANNKRKKSNSTDDSVAPTAAASSSSSASISAPPSKTAKTAKGGKKAASSSSIKDFGPPEDDDEEHWDSDDDGKGGEKGQDEKRKNFLERNRQAALKCRQRKKAWLASLQAKVEYLQNDNENLQNTVGALRNENMFLKSQLVQATGGAPLPMMPMMPMAPPPPHGVEHMQMMPHPAYMHPGASGPPMSQAQGAFVPPAQVHVPRGGMAPGFDVQRQRQRTEGDPDAGGKHEREWSNASDVPKQQSGSAATIKV
ncbi:hypothetical protein PANT_1d00041 [Moesziomyces antarcticus T-34]|uniref:BZIP domain-containing protein n=1 Tax=Pseudozyma antarctica (strain T-34) TaxID=1151754 RepID=M9LIW9_PSEA3|nr:hypothetical protein PANT_1d00041 [Moesziomyces antarcticus T-34]